MSVLIYKITSPSNKSYIGQVIKRKGIRARWRQHINCSKSTPEGGSPSLNRAILKYGEKNLIVEQICEVNEKLKDIAEQLCIAMYKTLSPLGYNLQTGGTYTEHCEETKQKRSKSLKQLLTNPEKRKIWSKVKKGVPQDNKKNRKYDEDYSLPKYIRRVRGKYWGYCIDSHPLCKCKKFTSIKLSDSEKYKLAIDHLNNLNNMVAVQRLKWQWVIF